MSLAILRAASQAGAQQATADTAPGAVVQRFVDAANVRDLDGMMATVAAEAVFAVLPSGAILASGRDSIRAFYDARLAPLDAGVTVEVVRRISNGEFVVDQEEFRERGRRSARGQVTWAYLVTGGLIRHAWRLKRDAGAGAPGRDSAPRVRELAGSRAGAGLFTQRLFLPANACGPVHIHDQELHGLVISGVLRMGVADSAETLHVREYPAGSFVVVPAGRRHVEGSGAAAEVHLSGIAPLRTQVVDSIATRCAPGGGQVLGEDSAR